MLVIKEFYGNEFKCIKTNKKLGISECKIYKIISDYIDSFSIINDNNEEIIIDNKYLKEYFNYEENIN